MKTINYLHYLLFSSVNFLLVNAEISACPLLGPRFPIPKTSSTSSIVQDGLKRLTAAFDAYVATGDGDFGPITPNTTSFGVALFSTEELDSVKPYFYEYHYTAAALGELPIDREGVDASTTYPIGDMPTLFTAWLFLINTGEDMWTDPVTKCVPELSQSTASLIQSLGKIE